MRWQRNSDWWAESDADYRIVMSRRGDGWVYLCYGPQRRDWRNAMRVRYGIGEMVPCERELIGKANEPEAARAICVEHWEQTNAA